MSPIGQPNGARLRVVSDFADFYDAWLDGEGDVWDRATRTALHRWDDLCDLAESGLRTPAHGMATLFEDDQLVVAYLDAYAHRGEGKRLMRAREVGGATYCSSFVGSRGESLRLVAAGRSFAWLRYRSASDWRSNVGEVSIELAKAPAGHEGVCYAAALRLQRVRRTPLLAIDFVHPHGGTLYALDLNTAPGLRGTPLEGLHGWAPQDVAAHLKARWVEVKRG